MELTKEQIQYIDHRLENEGIKYWDIRIELLDHVVSDIEQKLKTENSEYEFKEMVQESFVSLGWKENFNGGGLDLMYQQRLKAYTKISHKGIFSEYKKSLTNFKTLLFIVTFWLFVFLFQNNKQLLKFTMIICFVAFLIALIRFSFKYKIFKSVRLNSALYFAGLPLSLFNLFIYIPKLFFGYEKFSFTYILIIFSMITPLALIGLFSLLEEFKSAQKTYHKLLE